MAFLSMHCKPHYQVGEYQYLQPKIDFNWLFKAIPLRRSVSGVMACYNNIYSLKGVSFMSLFIPVRVSHPLQSHFIALQIFLEILS